MTQLLIFGGTRFFGKKTVQHFIDQGYDVTIATRGQLQDDFGTQVNRIIVDRQESTHPGWQIIAEKEWDIVFDNICYTWEAAKIALDYFQNVGHYLVTSSLAVYEGEFDHGFVESHFMPESYDIIPVADVSYGEGKRQVEAYFAKHASFPITYLRFPVVLDDDDYTERLHLYIRKALADQEIVFKRESGYFSYVKGSEIPLVIDFIMKRQVFGPLNISSDEAFTTAQFIASLKDATQKDLKIVYDEKTPDPLSHYDKAMNVDRLSQLGYPVTTLASWLPALMKRLSIAEKTK